MEDNNFAADFSLHVKNLMRDGIRYREGGYPVNAHPSSVVRNDCQSPSPHKDLPR